MKDDNHKFYGSTTVGERGQVVIPAEARRDLNISQGTKLLVFSGHGGDDLVLPGQNPWPNLSAKPRR